MNNYITIENVVKVYGKGKTEAALEGITSDFDQNNLTVIVGPSGSGKTTLLNCIGGLLRPSSGKVKVGDLLVSQAPLKKLLEFRRSEVGFVFQDYNLIPGLTVQQNICLPGYFTNKKESEVEKTSIELLERLQIRDLKDVDVNHLSGGERQRVSIAAALINDPKLLIADEPTAQLDPENTKIVIKILHEQAKAGKCVLVATHDPRVAREADRIFKLTRRDIAEVSLEAAFMSFE